MASMGLLTSLILGTILIAGLLDRAMAQTGCTTTLASLAPCLPFVGGNLSTPSSSCCSALSSMVQSSPRCLCSALNGGLPSLGMTINQTQALQLPGACNVQTPPVSQCNAASGPTASAASPVGAPVAAPTESTTNTPDATTAAATPPASTRPSGTTEVGGGRSKATPSPPTPVARGSSIKVSLQFVVSLLFVASFSSFAQRVL